MFHMTLILSRMNPLKMNPLKTKTLKPMLKKKYLCLKRSQENARKSQISNLKRMTWLRYNVIIVVTCFKSVTLKVTWELNMEGIPIKCLVKNVPSNVTIANVHCPKTQVRTCISVNPILSREGVELNKIKNQSSVTCVTESLIGKQLYLLIWLQHIQKREIFHVLIVTLR